MKIFIDYKEKLMNLDEILAIEVTPTNRDKHSNQVTGLRVKYKSGLFLTIPARDRDEAIEMYTEIAIAMGSQKRLLKVGE